MYRVAVLLKSVPLLGGAAAQAGEQKPWGLPGAEIVASGLEIPWALDFAPDGRIFVTERRGRSTCH